jgi:hypothetical protein
MVDSEVEDIDDDVLKYRIGQINERVWQRIQARCVERRRP